MTDNASRREFLKRSAALGITGAAAPFALNLAAVGEAAAATASDYKALVCIFLYGGCDHANTLTPYDQASYDLYLKARPGLAYPRAALQPTVLTPDTALPNGREYALAPALSPLTSVFNAGDLAVMLNVGTLIEPTTKAQYKAQSVRLPPKLFSHNDQQSFWQSSSPEGATSGWGGRIGDLFQAGNGSASLTCINVSGNAVLLSGRSTVQYAVSAAGPILLNNGQAVYGSAAATNALKLIMGGTNTNLFENEHARVAKRSIDLATSLSGALAAAVPIATPFPNTSLANQLRMVARLIAVSGDPSVAARRQVFFVSLGGFDLHDTLVARQPVLLDQVATAMRAFYDATIELGISDKVTAFTASDFGRTLVPNNDGSDHAWGSSHFVMGSAVRGKAFYGNAPNFAIGSDDDVGQGRFVPGISVDQYASTMASWFGVSATDMATVLPDIGNYDTSQWNLGFV
jgi:uncharacterized protein (DUF1501 family)